MDKNIKHLVVKQFYLKIIVSYHSKTPKKTYIEIIIKRINFFLASAIVNNVTIFGDYTLSNGNVVFLISEVLFVTEATVSRLHQVIKYTIYIILRENSYVIYIKDCGLWEIADLSSYRSNTGSV